MRTFWLIIAAGGFLGWCTAGADVIHLRSGRLEGEVIEKANGRVKIRTTSGIVTTVNESDVLAVEKRETAAEIYAAMAAKLKPGDTAGHFALANWCRDHGLKDEAVTEFVAVLQADPDHAAARKELGYVKTPHGWLTHEQAMRAEGKVLVDGSWLSAEEAKKRARVERERKLQQWIDAVVFKLHSPTASAHAELAAQLAAFDRVEMARSIQALLADRDADVRGAACASLAKMKYAPAISDLTRMALTDSDDDVRLAALTASARIDREKALEKFYDFATGLKLTPVTSLRRQRAVKRAYRRIALALDKIGDVRCVPVVIEILYPKVEIASSDGTGGVSVGGVRNLGISRASGGPTAVDVTSGGVDLGSARSLPSPGDTYYFNQAAEDLLKKLTGQNLGVLPRDWKKWWSANGAALLRKFEAKDRAEDPAIDKLLEDAKRESR